MSSSGAVRTAAAALVVVSYDPAGATTVSSTSTTFAAVDTTNLRATFTAPANGIVVVRYGGFLVNGAGAVNAIFGILEGASVLGVLLGAASTTGTFSGEKRLTGVTAGPHNYDLALATTTGATSVSVKYGGGLTAAGFGPAFIEVWPGV